VSYQSFKIGQTLVLRITSDSGYSFPFLMGHDAVIVDSPSIDFVRSTVYAIRRHHQSEVYLKPIFVQRYSSKSPTVLGILVDGFVDGVLDEEQIKYKTNDIFVRSLDLSVKVPVGQYGMVIKKALDLMYTRQTKVIDPILDPYSIIGFAYPTVSMSFEPHEETEVLAALDWAEHNGYIWPDFVEKIYLCNQCSAGILLFREVCPHCSSSNTYGEDLIHHFPCAYIGPISDFKKADTDALSCPKCNKNVHHVGVDYDKPAVLNHCNECDSRFQDIFVKAKCMHCSHDTDVQYLQARNINAYKLTKKGRLAITEGLTEMDEKPHLKLEEIQEEKTFKTLLHFDYIHASSLPEWQHEINGLVLSNVNDFSRHFGGFKKQSLIRELADIIKGEMTLKDFITLNNQGHFIWTTRKTLDSVVNGEKRKKVSDLIQQLIAENYDSFEIDLKHIVLNYNDARSGEELLKAMLQKLNRE
jgi:hypothetical protein